VARRRFGVVLLLRGAVGSEVDGLRRALGDPALGRVPPHVTLVPPVNVADVDAALDVLRSAASSVRPFSMTIGSPATFLPANPVLYLGVAGPVQEVRDLVFRPPLARTLTWPFVPHVTLLDGGPVGRLTAACEALADYRAEVDVDRVHLLEERRRPSDGVRVWEPVADAPFSTPAVVGRGGLELSVSVSESMAPDVASWFAEAWSLHDSRDDVPLVVVGRRAGSVVGVAKGFVRGPEGHLERLITAPGVRGEGVGSHLLAAFESAAIERGATFLSLRVRVGSPAEGLYRRRGFTTFTELPAWRWGDDFVQLRKVLS
jgi:ribosomal protein S18 acetylase RimI-like enzyme